MTPRPEAGSEPTLTTRVSTKGYCTPESNSCQHPEGIEEGAGAQGVKGMRSVELKTLRHSSLDDPPGV